MQTVEEIENHFTRSTKPLTADLHTRSKRNPDRIEVARVMVLGVENQVITVALRSALNYEDLFQAVPQQGEGGLFFVTKDDGRLPLDSVRDDATDQEVWSCGRIKEPRGDKSVARLNFERGRDIRTLATYVTNIREAEDVDRVVEGLNDFKAKYFGEDANLSDVSHLVQRQSDFIEPPAVTFNLAQLSEPGILPTPRVEETPEVTAPAPQEPEVEEGPKQRITNLGITHREPSESVTPIVAPAFDVKVPEAEAPAEAEPTRHDDAGEDLLEVKSSPESAPEAPESKREASTDEWVPTVPVKPLAEAPEVTQVHPDELPGTLTEHIVQLSEGREGHTSYHEGLPKDAVVVDDVNSLFDAPKQEAATEPEHRELVDEGYTVEEGEPESKELSKPEPEAEDVPEAAVEPQSANFFDELFPESEDDHEPVKPEGAEPAKSFLDLFNEEKKQEAAPQETEESKQEVYHDGNPLPGYPHEEERKPWVPPTEREQPKAETPEPEKQEEQETPKPVVDPNKNRSFLSFLDRDDPEDDKEDEDEDDLGPIKPVAQPKPVVAADLMSFLNDD